VNEAGGYNAPRPVISVLSLGCGFSSGLVLGRLRGRGVSSAAGYPRTGRLGCVSDFETAFVNDIVKVLSTIDYQDPRVLALWESGQLAVQGAAELFHRRAQPYYWYRYCEGTVRTTAQPLSPLVTTTSS